MASLLSESPGAGRLPVKIGGVTLSEEVPEGITWLAPFQGKAESFRKAFEKETGCKLPAPNEMTTGPLGSAVSVGPGETMFVGPSVSIGDCALVDQSDAWAVLMLSGEASKDVLARVTSIDLRADAFPRGATAQTMVVHMTASLAHVSENTFRIMVFRSMCRTAIHDLTRAMRGVAARDTL